MISSVCVEFAGFATRPWLSTLSISHSLERGQRRWWAVTENTGAGKIPLPVYNIPKRTIQPIRSITSQVSISQRNYLYLKPSFHISNSNSISQAVISQNQYLRYAYISTRCFPANFHISTPYLRYAHILKPQYFISQVHISDTSSYLNTFSRQGRPREMARPAHFQIIKKSLQG